MISHHIFCESEAEQICGYKSVCRHALAKYNLQQPGKNYMEVSQASLQKCAVAY